MGVVVRRGCEMGGRGFGFMCGWWVCGHWLPE